MLYFEAGSSRARVTGLRLGGEYEARWFDPRNGQWHVSLPLTADSEGTLALPAFPGGCEVNDQDWALKLRRLHRR